MPKGISIELAGGFARIEFIDPREQGPALAKLLEIGGTGLIDVDSRGSRRKAYTVPESVARDAGLLDDAPEKKPPARKAARKPARKAAAKPVATE